MPHFAPDAPKVSFLPTPFSLFSSSFPQLPEEALPCIPCPLPSDPCFISHVSLAIFTTLYLSWASTGAHWKSRNGKFHWLGWTWGFVLSLPLWKPAMWHHFAYVQGAHFCVFCFVFQDILSLFFTCTWTGAVKSNVASVCTPSVLSQKQPFHTASVVFLKVFMHKWVPCVILGNTKCIALSIWLYELLFSLNILVTAWLWCKKKRPRVLC